MTHIRTRVLDGFDDPTFGAEEWNSLLASNGDIVYMTWQWQRAWWETMQRGRLLLIVAERDGQVVALAPLYTQSSMVYFVSTEFESDYLDFIGDVGSPDVLDALLDTARGQVPGFLGFQLYFVPDASGSGRRLDEAAARLGLSCWDEGPMTAPVLDLHGRPELPHALANKKRLLECERFFRKNGTLDVHTFRDGDAVLAQLDQFFDQHISRWERRENPSRFLQEKPRRLLKCFTDLAADTGWLRFMRLDWNGRPIAFHYGLCYQGRFFWGPTSFAIDLAKRSPGQVLVRQLLLSAIEERARILDFGTGDAEFKLQFASHTNLVRTWGLYPSQSARRSEAPGMAETIGVL